MKFCFGELSGKIFFRSILIYDWLKPWMQNPRIQGRPHRSSRGPSRPQARHAASSSPVSGQSQHICPLVQPQAAGCGCASSLASQWQTQLTPYKMDNGKRTLGRTKSAAKETKQYRYRGGKPKWTSAVTEEALTNSTSRKRGTCGRGASGRLSQKEGRSCDKDADGEEGTPAKPQAEATPGRLRAWRFPRIKAGAAGADSERSRHARQWKDTYSTVQVLCQEGRAVHTTPDECFVKK